MTESNIESKVDRLAGSLDAFRQNVDGRFNVMDYRLVAVEAWKGESEKFHIEQRSRWDKQDGAQAAEAKIQAERHADNQERMQTMANRIGRNNLIVALIGLLFVIIGTMVAVFSYQAGYRKSHLDHSTEFGPESAQIQLTAGGDWPQ